ncbi:hypothetical protein ACFW2V_37720 [Streptomyces sp. NPDC058947]|uniref:hypothetical protein n=1 Tax=Streptomyces sp. NPDC058947 TaxID=3346675 RepID=UPI00367ACEDD
MTKAHVPPQAAGNRDRVVSANVRLKDRVLGHGRIAQGGMWFHGLCSECNSMAGAHYDAAYADFSNAMLARVNLQQRLYLPPVRLAPARVARSILIGMFATSPHLRVMFRGLAEDLRNRRDRITMPDGASLRLAVCLDRRTRLAGMYNAVRVIRHIEHYDVFSEVYFRPWLGHSRPMVGGPPSMPINRLWKSKAGLLSTTGCSTARTERQPIYDRCAEHRFP